MADSSNASTAELPAGAEIAPAPPLSQDDLTPQTPPEPAEKEKSSHESVSYRPILGSPSRHLTFVRHGRWRRYRAQQPTRLANSLLASVGFLEAANAGDFAANVWNNIPVPTHAIVLMAIGSAVALGMVFFAAKDALLSWQNIRGLRAERSYLKRQRERHRDDIQMQRIIECLLDVNFRETGTEWVDRVGLDTIMGFGALLISAGTILAIFGADPNIYAASNLLSGYIGNAPCSVYGLLNLIWSLYVWRRAYRHASTGSRSLSERTTQKLRRRTSSVKLHGSLNGITGIVAGVASLITATMWWGYVVLAPCIVAAVAANFLWRYRVGYTRPLIRELVPFNEDAIEAELSYVEARQRQTTKPTPKAYIFDNLVSDPSSLREALDFLVLHELFEDFGVRVSANADLRAKVGGDVQGKTMTLEADGIAAVDGATRDQLLGIAKSIIIERAHKHFLEQERYLLEILGCYLCSPVASSPRA